MDTIFKDPLLDEVEAYLSQSQVSATEFGRDAVNDGSFVTGLRAGRETRRKTASRVRQYMRDNPAMPEPTPKHTTPPVDAGECAA